MKTGRSVVSSQSLQAKDAVANSTSRSQTHDEAPESWLPCPTEPLAEIIHHTHQCVTQVQPTLPPYIFHSFDALSGLFCLAPQQPSASLVYPGPV